MPWVLSVSAFFRKNFPRVQSHEPQDHHPMVTSYCAASAAECTSPVFRCLWPRPPVFLSFHLYYLTIFCYLPKSQSWYVNSLWEHFIPSCLRMTSSFLHPTQIPSLPPSPVPVPSPPWSLSWQVNFEPRLWTAPEHSCCSHHIITAAVLK